MADAVGRLSKPKSKRSYPWMESDSEAGFSSLGVVIALSLVVTLIFTSAQVYWVNSKAADIQFAADAGALAAENVVAEYYVVARVADAVVLSMTLFGVTVLGVSIIVACIPVPGAISVSADLLRFARDVFKARDDLARQASEALNTLQKVLPFVAIANAAVTVQANAPDGWSYYGLAILVPFSGEEIEYPESDPKLEEHTDDIEELNQQAEQAMEQATEAKQEMDQALHDGWYYDCGKSTEIGSPQCMHERAERFNGSSHSSYYPLETWSFTVALHRAQDYYQYRPTNDKPKTSSTQDHSKYQIRCLYYQYAYQQLAKAPVIYHEDGTAEVIFPTMPTNLSQLRSTWIFTDRLFSADSDGCLHGTTDCPVLQASGSAGKGSLKELEDGKYKSCPECQMTAATVGQVWSLTAADWDDYGFEKWYSKVAEASRGYNNALKQYTESMKNAEDSTDKAADQFDQAIELVKTKRLDPHPPGRRGCIVFVVDPQTRALPAGLKVSLLAEPDALPPRVAVSAAALARDTSQDSNILSNFLDRLKDEGHSEAAAFVVPFDVVMDIWGAALMLYDKGVSGLCDGIRTFVSEASGGLMTGLGEKAATAIEDGLKNLGLEPVDLYAPKPVLVNSYHVASVAEGAGGSALINVKDFYASFHGYASGSLTDMVFDDLVIRIDMLADDLKTDGISYTFSLGEYPFNVQIPVSIPLPEGLIDQGKQTIQNGIEGLRDKFQNGSQTDVWE